MATHTGSLSGRKKKDLQAIADQMGLKLLNTTRFDLEEGIRDALRLQRALRTNPSFSGLWDHIQRRSKTDSDTESDTTEEDEDEDEEEEDEEDSTPAYRPSARGTPRRSTSTAKLAASYVEKIVDKVVAEKDALAVAVPRRLTRSTSQLGLIVRKSSTNLRQAAAGAKDSTVTVVANAQETLSNSWTLNSVLVGAELAFLAYAAVPWKHVTQGPHHWLTRSPTPAFKVHFPDLSILLHPTFTSSFLRWSLLTVLLPLIVSIFLARPNAQPPTRRRSKKSIAPPNALSFAIARLASTILSGYIFASQSKTHWTFNAVEGYPAVSVLGSALAVAYAAFAEGN